MHLDTITTAVSSGDWTLAEQDTNELETAWKSIIKKVQYSSERSEINDLSVSLAD